MDKLSSGPFAYAVHQKEESLESKIGHLFGHRRKELSISISCHILCRCTILEQTANQQIGAFYPTPATAWKHDQSMIKEMANSLHDFSKFISAQKIKYWCLIFNVYLLCLCLFIQCSKLNSELQILWLMKRKSPN